MTERPRPLLFAGNKRSGTSLLVRLLNLHPRVFVTHESDVIWILHQAAAALPGAAAFRSHPWDGAVGMEATLRAAGDLVEELRRHPGGEAAVPEAYFRIQDRLMRNGSDVQPVLDKSGLLWVGDKKPVQQADPELRPFLERHFPDARFVHLVRHPRATVASMLAAARAWAKVAYWKGGAAEVLERWAVHEEWALDLKARGKHPVHTVRFEDIALDPQGQLAAIFRFLEVDPAPAGLDASVAEVTRDLNEKYADFELPPCPRAERIMALHGYRA